jgi:enediyne biosynthesis protein E4
LKGNGKGDFSVVPSKKSGFFTIGQVRKMLKINQGNKSAIVLAKNNDKAQVFSINKK